MIISIASESGGWYAYLYVVELVTLTHHAVLYEMNTVASPEKVIAAIKSVRPSAGLKRDKHLTSISTKDIFWYWCTYKFRLKDAAVHDSKSSEKITRTGMESKLL